MPRMPVLLIIMSFALACADPHGATDVLNAGADGSGGGHRSSATMQFGRDNVGSPFPAPTGHDASYHAIDNISPQNVNIAAGGTVTFNMGTFHQVAIYAPGTVPADIDVTSTVDLFVPSPPAPAPDLVVAIPGFIIDDPANRIATSPFSFFGPMTWTSPPGTFDQPGRYLVICTVVPHFVSAKMYAWVTVR
jgi:plastocyanin